jgi:pyrroloquinoline-quinone synthase
MDLVTLEQRLSAAVAPHDLLCHPFYEAWSKGELTESDLRGYAAQYAHQVRALPGLLGAALARCENDDSRRALARNLDEEAGKEGAPHAELWTRFADGLGDARDEAPLAETTEAIGALRALAEGGDVDALAALWCYEMQTANVSRTKLEGLAKFYAMTDERSVSFFSLHESLDVHHAAELLAAVARATNGDETLVTRACERAADAACAQWRFLDGLERRRQLAAA